MRNLTSRSRSPGREVGEVRLDWRSRHVLIKWGKEFGFSLHDSGSDIKNKSACSAGDPRLIPGSGKSAGEGHGNPLQYSHLEIPWTEGPGGLLSVGSQESNTTNTTWNAQETTGRFCRGNSHYLAENLSAPRRTSCNGGRLGYRRGPSISAFTSKWYQCAGVLILTLKTAIKIPARIHLSDV